MSSKKLYTNFLLADIVATEESLISFFYNSYSKFEDFSTEELMRVRNDRKIYSGLDKTSRIL
jgi:hypothetical protein